MLWCATCEEVVDWFAWKITGERKCEKHAQNTLTLDKSNEKKSLRRSRLHYKDTPPEGRELLIRASAFAEENLYGHRPSYADNRPKRYMPEYDKCTINASLARTEGVEY